MVGVAGRKVAKRARRASLEHETFRVLKKFRWIGDRNIGKGVKNRPPINTRREILTVEGREGGRGGIVDRFESLENPRQIILKLIPSSAPSSAQKFAYCAHPFYEPLFLPYLS